jgi:hypothetical protein
VLKQSAGCWGNVPPTIRACDSPLVDLRTDLVDPFVLLDAVLGPARIETQLGPSLATRWRDWNEVGARAPTLDNLVCDAVVCELPVLLGSFKRGIEDGVLYDDWSPALLCFTIHLPSQTCLEYLRIPTTGDPRRAERMLLLPTIDFLQHGFSHEISDTVEVIVAINDSYEVVVVAPLDAAGHRDLRQDLLLWFGESGGRHRRNVKEGRDL